MYCSKCGNIVNDNLNYCNSCGAKLTKEKDSETPKTMLDNILTTLFLVVMFGLGILVGLVAVLLDKEVDHKAIMIISGLYLAAIFGICYLLLSQVPKLIDANLKSKENEIDNRTPLQMSAPNTAQLPEARDMPARVSVTENTTKTLDEVLVKRN